MSFWTRRDHSLNEEIEDYLARETADNIARGMPPEDARAAARRKLGNATTVKEDTRAAWGWLWFERLWQDLRHARRMLAKNPGFSAVAVLSLAIGVGANCAMFSEADLVLLRPLPVPRPGEVVTVGSSRAGDTPDMLLASYPDYTDLRDRSQTLQGLAGFAFTRVRFAKQLGAPPDVKMGMTVTGDFFRVLEVEPELGRGFLPEEDEVPGRDPVLVLSHSFWEQEFAADPAVLGRPLWINGIEFTVIGVAPERFTSIDQWVHPTVYLPVMMNPRLTSDRDSSDLEYLAKRDARFLQLKGRLKPGVSVDQARAEVAALGTALAAEYPATNRNFAMSLRTELENRQQYMQQAGVMVVMLMVLAGAILMAACANVAGLLTSRAPARAREIAVRMALGSGSGRLVRQLMTGNALLAGAGALLGLGFGYAGIAFLDRFTYVSDLPVVISPRMDERAMLVGLAAAVASVFLFGLVPAWRASRADLVSDLKNAGAMHRARRPWGRNILVAGQVAVALVLLTVASFLYLGFRKQMSAGPGYRTDHLLTAEFDPSLVNYTAQETEQFYKDLTDRARELPGARSAALASFLPLTAESQSNQIAPEGYEFPEGIESASVLTSRVDQGYFGTLAIPILEGRAFRATDDAEAPPVAVVNETLAAQYWPGQNPVGKRFRLDGGETWVEIVGVAQDGKYLQLTEAPARFLYLPYAQHPRSEMILMLESAGDPAGLAAPVRDLVRQIDPEQPMFEVRTMKAFFDQGPVRSAQLLVEFVAVMGLMGMGLALTGLYGLVAYTVSARRREIAIRMSIGAGQGKVLRMVLRQGLVLAASGVVIGVVVSFGVKQVLESVFPAGGDLTGYVVVVPAVLAVATLATLIPARRAARIDPASVLRHE